MDLKFIQLHSVLNNFFNELGLAWSSVGIGILLVSIYLGTWTLIAFFLGAGIALKLSYNQPISTTRDRLHQPNSLCEDVIVDKYSLKAMPEPLRSQTNDLIQNIIRDYVKWWYRPPAFLEDTRFPMACRQTLIGTSARAYAMFSRKDPVFFFDLICTNLVAVLGVILGDLRSAIKSRSDADPNGLKSFVRSNPTSALARMLQKEERRADLAKCADRILTTLMEQEDINCSIAFTFMHRVLTLSIMESAITGLANKDHLNTKIVAWGQHKPAETQAAKALNLATDTVMTLEKVNGVDDEPTITDEEIAVPEAPPSPRGRRLSFRKRRTSSMTQDEIQARLDSPKRSNSLLKRTASLLKSTRSRSRSPSKNFVNIDVPAERSNVDLAYADFVVIDSLEGTDVPLDVVRYTIMITPKSNDEKGLCVLRSAQDFLNLRRDIAIENGLPQTSDLATIVRVANIQAYLNELTRDEEVASGMALRRFCDPELLTEESFETRPATTTTKSNISLAATLQKEGDRDAQEDPVKRSFESNVTSASTLPVTKDKALSWRGLTHSRASSRSISPKRRKEPEIPIPPPKSRLSLTPFEFQNLVNQCLELLSAFLSLSSRTWTIRKQLLGLLRNLLLSKNSAYTLTFQTWLEETIINPLGDADFYARHLANFNLSFFTPITAPEPLSRQESNDLAKAARQVFLARGMPTAIKNLMGTDCVEESLGNLFDVLQDAEFAEGLATLVFTESVKLLLSE